MHSCHSAHSWGQDNTSIARKVVSLAQQPVLRSLEQLSPEVFCRTLPPPVSRAALFSEITLQASCSPSEQPTLSALFLQPSLGTAWGWQRKVRFTCAWGEVCCSLITKQFMPSLSCAGQSWLSVPGRQKGQGLYWRKAAPRMLL